MEVETDRLACPLKPYIPNRVDVWVCTEQRSPSDQTTYVDTAHCVAQGQSPRLDRSILHRRHASLSTQSSVTQEGHVLLHQEKKKHFKSYFLSCDAWRFANMISGIHLINKVFCLM